MSGPVVIRRCASAEEAAIVCGLLRDAGIRASLENWHHAMTDWGTLLALGGVGIIVPSDDVVTARQAIVSYSETAEERLRGDFPDLDSTPMPPKRYRHMILLGYYTGLLLLPFTLAGMLIEIFRRATISPASGHLDWSIVQQEILGAHWPALIVAMLSAALYFLVPFAIFVSVSRQFLARRAALKATL